MSERVPWFFKRYPGGIAFLNLNLSTTYTLCVIIEWMQAYKYEKTHRWLRQQYGNPNKCEHCGKAGEYNTHKWRDKTVKRWDIEWALIIGKNHERNIANYMGLCMGCHHKYDRYIEKCRRPQ